MNLLDGIKTETVTVTRIGYSDIDRIISRGFDIPDYECVAFEEWSNDMNREIEVVPRTLDDHDKKLLARAKHEGSWSWKGGGMMYRTRDLLCELCCLGQLPAGRYLIDVSW